MFYVKERMSRVTLAFAHLKCATLFYVVMILIKEHHMPFVAVVKTCTGRNICSLSATFCGCKPTKINANFPTKLQVHMFSLT